MSMRFNRVRRLDYADDDLVYTLVLENDGLYLIHTGNTGGLVQDQVEAKLNEVVLDENTMPFVREILENEEKVKNVSPRLLLNEEHNLFVPFADITDISADTEAYLPTMAIRTPRGGLNLVFTYHRDDDVRQLLDAIETHTRSGS